MIQRAAPIDGKGFDKEVHVIFEEYGYMATAYLGMGISADEAKEIADASGNLKEYERKTVKYRDGITSLDEVTKAETVKRKFVYLTLEITNTKDAAALPQGNEICTLYSLNYLKEGENGIEPLDAYQDNGALLGTEPVYFDGSMTENTDSHFFWATPEKGETLTCHLGYLTDEDLLPYMYINTSFDGAVNRLTDIRQK